MSRGPSEEIKKQIIEHWNAGDTSGEIAKRFHMTRNSVIGIVQRFKGPKRSNPATSYPRKRQLEQKPLQEPKPQRAAAGLSIVNAKQTEKILDLHGRHYRPSQIAAAMKIPYAEVERVIEGAKK